MSTITSDLDELMSNLGEFGRYQREQVMLHLLGSFTAGVHMLSLVTVAAVPAHTCNVPNFSEGAELPHAIDSCFYADENNVSQACTSWTYDYTYHKSSRAIDWDMVCSRRWMGAMAQAAYMFGVFIGAVTLGSLADKYGRKIIFNISAALQLILGVSVAFVPEYYSFLFMRFLYGIFGSAGSYITGFVLCMELVGASRRTICGVMFQVTFSFGFMLVAGWGALIQSRLWLQVVYGLHGLVFIGHWWLMDESPRWLWAQNRVLEAVAIVQKGLRKNKNPLVLSPQKYLSKAAKVVNNINRRSDRKYSAKDLFIHPKIRYVTLNICFNWFANSIVYYGLSLNTGVLLGNPFVMLFLCGIVELPSYAIVLLIMDRIGRRSLISKSMILGGIFCIVAAVIPNETEVTNIIVIVIVLLGKACIAASFAVIYNYSAELFPTVLRNTAIGIGAMCARLSGTLTPMIILLDTLNPMVPAIFFGICSGLAGFLSLYLKETLNEPMPETLEDVL